MRMGGELIKLFGFVDFRKESISFGGENSGAKRIRSTEKHSGCTPVFGVRSIFSNVLPHFAAVTAPVQCLLEGNDKKRKKFVWSDSCPPAIL